MNIDQFWQIIEVGSESEEPEAIKHYCSQK
jgi:hypothetical protein